jgi:hypothetical protein
MTIHGPGTPITMQQINAEFGLGTNLNAYRGVRWYKDDASTGTFDTTNIDMAEFYSKRATSPVTPGSQTFTSNGTFTVPTYSLLTVTIRGGSGGGAGGSGNVSVGSSGSAGTASSFGIYGSGDFGRGGTISAVGANGAGSDGTPAGGAGGAGSAGGPAGYAGGAGGKTVLSLSNPVVSGTGPVVGSSVSVTVGSGGAGGVGGSWVIYPVGGTAFPGSNGSSGSVVVQWS